MKNLILVFLIASGWIYTSVAQPVRGNGFVIPEQGLSAFFRQQTLVSAHRGGPKFPGYPENCIETFDHLLSQIPAVIELDVEMTADSMLILMHDITLDRTTTGTGPVSARTWKELQSLRLKANDGTITEFGIPLFNAALLWALAKEAVLTVDVKRNVPFDLVVRHIEQCKEMENRAAIITYNAQDALTVHRLNPRLVISANMRNLEELERTLATGIPPKNLIAFVGTREPDPALYERLRDLGIPAILGTLGNLDNMAIARGDHLYKQFVERGASILATDRPVEAYRALKE